MTKLEAALHLAERGFRVFPLHPNSKIPAIKKFSTEATTDLVKIERWFKGREFNIGIATDELLVVDVDTKNPLKDGVKTLEKLNNEGKVFPPTTTQITPTRGFHLIYKVKEGVRNSVSKLGEGLDIRGVGGYIVGAGSTIDGVPYELKDAPLEETPDWLFKSCKPASHIISLASEVAANVDPERALKRGRKILFEMEPITEGERNHAAYKAANRLKDIGMTQTDIFFLMNEEWKCEPPLEQHELAAAISSAFKYGQEPQGSASAEALFGELPTDVSTETTHPLKKLNEEYAFVIFGKKHSVIFETTDACGDFEAQFLDENTFHAKLASLTFQDSSGKATPLSRMWMRYEGRRSYDGITFSPGLDVSDRFYNLWRGFGVKELSEKEKITETMKRAVESFEEHIFENVCDSNADHFAWVMAWFAHMIQKPWEKPKTALVLRGKKGVGKNAIFETFQPMFPNNYLVAGDRRYLTSNFNAHLERLLLFVADEAFWSGDKAADGILKSLITDEKINIERKGKDPFTIESCHRIAILGNEKWVVPASHDERRYAVFNMGEGRKQDRNFFGSMARNMEQGGVRYLFTKLNKMDISGIDIGKIPLTEGLLEQKKHSGGPLAKWWFSNLSKGMIDETSFTGESGWPAECELEALTRDYANYARSRGMGKYLEDSDGVFSALKEFCSGVRLIKKASGERVVKLPSLRESRDAWDRYMGMHEKWDT